MNKQEKAILKGIKEILVRLAAEDELPMDMNRFDTSLLLPAFSHENSKEPETETHEYLDHPDGGIVSAEYSAKEGRYKEPLGITPGEWGFDDGGLYSSLEEHGHWIMKAPVDNPSDVADMEAICNAMNGTYKKGYDPLQVDALYKALDNLQKVAAKETANLVAWDGAEPLDKAIDQALQALKNSKL
jgi:hypothetical protein